MIHVDYSFAETSAHFILRFFLGFVKSLILVAVCAVCVLIASQFSVAPVSLRLLSAYGMEYATTTFKPYRHYFPEPFLIELETK